MRAPSGAGTRGEMCYSMWWVSSEVCTSILLGRQGVEVIVGYRSESCVVCEEFSISFEYTGVILCYNPLTFGTFANTCHSSHPRFEYLTIMFANDIFPVQNRGYLWAGQARK